MGHTEHTDRTSNNEPRHRFLRSEGSDSSQTVERIAVRLGVPVLLAASLVTAVFISADTDEVPSIAAGNHVIFALQLLLLIFYSLMLVLVPLVRALAAGELPVELTLKGPRYPEGPLRSSKKIEGELTHRVTTLERTSEQEVSLVAEAVDEMVEDLNDLQKAVEKLTQGGNS